MTGIFRGDDTAGALRAGLLLLVVLGVAGTAVSLAYERHWATAWQWAPWITLGVITLATVALIVRQTAATVWLARAAAAVAIVSSVLGVWQHVDANLDPDHVAGDHTHAPATSAEDAEDEEAASSDHHGNDEEEAASSDHHGNDDEESASSDHHADDEATTPPANGPAADEGAEASETSMMDVLTGSAGSVPVPAALAIAPVGLALALATIGLGGRRSAPPR